MSYVRPEAWWRQLPTGVDPIAHWPGFVAWLDSRGDPRVADWPLMQSIWPTLALCVAYLVLVYGGMALMRNREPFGLKGAMTVYNVVVASSNGWMFYRIVSGMLRHGYKPICNSVNYGAEEEDIAFVIYCYYLSKLVDFTDTFFMVLRKKFDQASFLHVYHHASMFVIWWMAVKWAAGGDGLAGPLLNTFVHAVMYTYYLCTTLGIHIPGKKYLTQLQMSQMAFVIVHSTSSLVLDCQYPHWTLYAQIIFLLSLLVLFWKFYKGAYKGKKPKAQ